MRHSIIMKSGLSILLAVTLLVTTVSAQTDEAAIPDIPKNLYIVPFLNVMVPQSFSSNLFDVFVDELMAFGDQHDMKIRILKQNIDLVDKEWLAQQHFITGEIFGYLEDSGCCSTEIEVKARIYTYRPGSAEPAREIVIPDDTFFDHDATTLEEERILLADRMAQELAEQLSSGFIPK